MNTSTHTPQNPTPAYINALAQQLVLLLENLNATDASSALLAASNVILECFRANPQLEKPLSAFLSSQTNIHIISKLRTPKEAKTFLHDQGISIAEFCRQHNIPSASLVYEILKGRKRCLRGHSHNIAVLLGMQHGVVTTRPGRVARAPRNTAAQMGAAA